MLNKYSELSLAEDGASGKSTAQGKKYHSSQKLLAYTLYAIFLSPGMQIITSWRLFSIGKIKIYMDGTLHEEKMMVHTSDCVSKLHYEDFVTAVLLDSLRLECTADSGHKKY